MTPDSSLNTLPPPKRSPPFACLVDTCPIVCPMVRSFPAALALLSPPSWRLFLRFLRPCACYLPLPRSIPATCALVTRRLAPPPRPPIPDSCARDGCCLLSARALIAHTAVTNCRPHARSFPAALALVSRHLRAKSRRPHACSLPHTHLGFAAARRSSSACLLLPPRMFLILQNPYYSCG